MVMTFILAVQLIMIYYGGSIFRTSGLTLKELLITVLFAATVIPFDFIRKITLRMKGIKGGV